MKIVKIVILILAITSLATAEQSVYSDSDFIDIDSVAKKNSREIFILNQKISQLKEQIEGLKSLVASQSDSIEQLKQKENKNLETIINELSQRVATLESKPAQVIIQKKETPNRAIEGTVTPKSSNDTLIKEKSKSEPKVKSSKELYKLAVLNYKNGKYTSAKKSFNQLKSRNYKRSSVSFYLGEIAFKKGKFKKAISYYQESANLNDKASYMDKLLLHTAISLKKKGRSDKAKFFFDAVVSGYPNSSAAKEAKKYLK